MTSPSSRSTNGQRTIVLAHRHTLLREGLMRILREAGFTVQGHTDTVSALHRLVVQHQPALVLLDWDLSDGGAEAIRALCQEAPRGHVVILTRPQPPEVFLAAMQAGASGYLSVNLPPDEFAHALHMVANGDFVVSREMSPKLREELASNGAPEPKDGLSDREREVLSLVALGATNREIAQNLTVTENTVKVHLRRILDKLNLRNRQQAAAYAVREGLVSDTDPLSFELPANAP